MTNTTSTWVAKDSTNQAAWNVASEARATHSSSEKVAMSKAELIGPKVSMKRRISARSQRRGACRSHRSTSSSGKASSDRS